MLPFDGEKRCRDIVVRGGGGASAGRHRMARGDVAFTSPVEARAISSVTVGTGLTWRQHHKTDPANSRVSEFTARQAPDTSAAIDDIGDTGNRTLLRKAIILFHCGLVRIRRLYDSD